MVQGLYMASWGGREPSSGDPGCFESLIDRTTVAGVTAGKGSEADGRAKDKWYGVRILSISPCSSRAEPGRGAEDPPLIRTLEHLHCVAE